jgi:hypothetical protein
MLPVGQIDTRAVRQVRRFDRTVAERIGALVKRLLRASTVRFAVEDPASRDARWCIGQYLRELDSRFDTGFDASRA